MNKFFDNTAIGKIKECLIEVYNPKSIYIFGSYAWGSPKKDSDIDIFIVVKESKLSMSERSRSGYKKLHGTIYPLDIIVYTEKELEERKTHPSSLSHKILEKGINIYEAA